jgi:hypothetical protein
MFNICLYLATRITQLLQGKDRLMAKESQFYSWQKQDIFLFSKQIQIRSAHPASYSMGSGESIPAYKVSGA